MFVFLELICTQEALLHFSPTADVQFANAAFVALAVLVGVVTKYLSGVLHLAECLCLWDRELYSLFRNTRKFPLTVCLFLCIHTFLWRVDLYFVSFITIDIFLKRVAPQKIIELKITEVIAIPGLVVGMEHYIRIDAIDPE